MDDISAYDSDYEERFEEYRRNILKEDNKDKFLYFLKEYYEPGLLPPDVVVIVTCDAEKCAKALLEEETGYIFDIHRSTDEDSDDYGSPLHLVSHPGLCRLLLSHGAQPNIRTTPKELPLNLVLGGLGYYVYGQGWPPTFDPADHIFRVIIKLCLPELRGRLEVVRMVLELTEEAEKEISGYATQGEVIQLAALLIVDREKVMPSVLKTLFPNDLDLEGSLAFRNFMLTLENQKVVPSESNFLPGFDDYNKKVSKLALMMPVFHLLGIFAKVGDRINVYLKQEQWKKVCSNTTLISLAS
ncbi:hypothetical protein CCACVL1_06645 [Corchorus capsularis]|uniref:Ankyrin repeat-containing protein n=1 Tax=Corchorus capsularis TaxID=210143 RepID=A0A1R3JDZ3_COCAP|nr:hypothetical protein CCACVL1_06645 [Corchorus capsularis]